MCNLWLLARDSPPDFSLLFLLRAEPRWPLVRYQLVPLETQRAKNTYGFRYACYSLEPILLRKMRNEFQERWGEEVFLKWPNRSTPVHPSSESTYDEPKFHGAFGVFQHAQNHDGSEALPMKSQISKPIHCSIKVNLPRIGGPMPP